MKIFKMNIWPSSSNEKIKKNKESILCIYKNYELKYINIASILCVLK